MGEACLALRWSRGNLETAVAYLIDILLTKRVDMIRDPKMFLGPSLNQDATVSAFYKATEDSAGGTELDYRNRWVRLPVTGRLHALLIACTYHGNQVEELAGPSHDVRRLSEFLKHIYGFQKVKVLTDSRQPSDQQDPRDQGDLGLGAGLGLGLGAGTGLGEDPYPIAEEYRQLLAQRKGSGFFSGRPLGHPCRRPGGGGGAFLTSYREGEGSASSAAGPRAAAFQALASATESLPGSATGWERPFPFPSDYGENSSPMTMAPLAAALAAAGLTASPRTTSDHSRAQDANAQGVNAQGVKGQGSEHHAAREASVSRSCSRSRDGRSSRDGGSSRDQHSSRSRDRRSGNGAGRVNIREGAGRDLDGIAESDFSGVPTRAEIVSGCEWLIEESRAGDALVFYYAGHGLPQTKRHECRPLLPLDHRENGAITATELRRLLIDKLPKGVRLIVVLDSCHSGAGLVLPYHYDRHSHCWRKLYDVDVGKDVTLYASCSHGESAADITLLDAKKDRKVAGGAMSMAFLASLRKSPFGHSCASLVNSMLKLMRDKKLTQTVNMSSTVPFDLDRRFSLIDIYNPA
ncbi:putative metacaspase [Gregarina niphandrodes]|uniref:Metacaspase n=1 Tax=Gregarina niphandrodes TaxID=110365 RepID=A0A023B2F3_GRENI|nr:putative metacaspase [Gregarina niphandrodes]EZG51806.1 putative metacaspase [Gregarina niphandrodes]|eukprot:XP_011131917.1 putative metacaspase [Gregarina niphandrodes]